MFRRTVVCLLVPVLWSTLHLAQGGARITGLVLRADTSLPLAGVRIELVGSNATVQTGKDGIFEFNNLRSGRYRLIPVLDGYVQAHAAHVKAPREAGVWVQVTSGTEEHVELRMEGEAILTGRVADAKGAPLAGLRVNLLRHRYDEFGNRTLATAPGIPIGSLAASRSKTNDRGEFRIYGLLPGEYYIQVPGAYYPGTRDSDRAKPVQLQSGENPPITLVVVDEVQAIARTSVKLRLDGEIPDAIAAEVQRGDGGFIVFGPFTNDVLLPKFTPGQFDVFIRWRNSSSTDLLYSRFTVDTRGGDVLQDVSVKRGVEVKGELVLQNEGPDSPSLENTRCRLRSPFLGSIQEATAASCLGGKYAHGDYQLDLENLPEDAYVASVTQKGSTRNLLTEGIEIKQETQLEILVRAPGSIIEGVVRDSKGELLQEATVVAVPEESFRRSGLLYRSAVSDVKGRFQLRGIAPGNYSLFVWADVEGPAYRNAQFLETYEDQAVRIRVGKGDRIRLDLLSF